MPHHNALHFTRCGILSALCVLAAWSPSPLIGQETEDLQSIPPIESSWDDLLEGVDDADDWAVRKADIRQRFLKLLRDDQKPDRPPLDLQVHERVQVDSAYERQLISYRVEGEERAHAYLGIPRHAGERQLPAIVALHGTFPQGKSRVAGLVDNPDKAYLDHLCRRGYVVIAPDHFVAGHRTPEAGAYETEAFCAKHPNWTAVGKFTFEHSIAIDVLESLPFVDPDRVGAVGHSLGGHGTLFLAAYDDRVKVAAANCSGPTFRHNLRVLDWSRDRWYIYFKHLRPKLLAGDVPNVDFHEIMALVAPRTLVDVSALNDGNPASQRQRVLMLMKVMQVFELEGHPERFSFYVHGGGHSVPHRARELMYAVFDEVLKPETTLTKRVDDK